MFTVSTNEPPFADQIRRCAHDLGRDGMDALGALYDLAAQRLVRYALTVNNNQDDAEDAMQAALVRVAGSPELLAKARHPWAYFLRIVRNEALRIARRRTPLPLNPETGAAVSRSGPECDQFDTARFVKQSLEKLPAPQLEVVVLKVWEDMTFAEIAEVLGQSPNTVASRYRYALQKLSQYLKPLCDDATCPVVE